VYVYGPEWCTWCQTSAKILKTRNIPHSVHEPTSSSAPRAHQAALSTTRRYPLIFVGLDPVPLGGYQDLCAWADYHDLPPTNPSPLLCQARCLTTRHPCTSPAQHGAFYCTVHQKRARRSIPVFIYTHNDDINSTRITTAALENILNVHIITHLHTTMLCGPDVTTSDLTWFPASHTTLRHHQKLLKTHKYLVIAGWEDQTQTFTCPDMFQRWAQVARARIQCTVPGCYSVSERYRGLCVRHHHQ
jgi:glutaredoxin